MNDFAQNSGNLYQTFEDILAEADCELSASEFQGIIAGMISAGLKPTDTGWLSLIVEVANNDHSLPDEALKAAQKLFAESQQAFIGQDVLAPILLPDEEYPLIDRVEAMTFWSQGYLLGFGLQHGNGGIDSVEIRESLQDISDISQLEISTDDSEESQMALETLIEHIKVAVKVIYMELVTKKEITSVNSLDGNDTFH